MNREDLIAKIIQKKEFSELPRKDVELIFSENDKNIYSDEEKVKFTRDALRKIYSVYASLKLFNAKNKDAEWFLKKHISTRERYDFYPELYNKIFSYVKGKEISVVDLGAGINGFSYGFFPKNKKINYTAVEAVGQLAEVMNIYFEKNKIQGKAIHESLFNISEIKKIIQKQKSPRIIFLFKVVDSLEMTKRDFSKKLLEEVVPISDLVVVSFATRSLVSGKKFNVKRYWFENYVKENFNVVDDFFIGGERYFILRNKVLLKIS